MSEIPTSDFEVKEPCSNISELSLKSKECSTNVDMPPNGTQEENSSESMLNINDEKQQQV